LQQQSNWVKNERIIDIEVASDAEYVYDIMRFNNETLIVSGHKKLSFWKHFFVKK
jgi:3-dehydroquinate dehydratase